MRRALPVVLLVPLVIGAFVVVRNVGYWLSAADDKRPVDALVVSSGNPEVRIPVALDAFRRGLATQVWVLASRGAVTNEAENIALYAQRGHLKGPAIRFLPESASTLSDARTVNTAVTASKGAPRTIAVVTAPWAVTRTRLTFERTIERRVLVWSDGSAYDAPHWWRGSRTMTAIESAKTLVTLAVLGPLPTHAGATPPPSLPLRALAGGFVGAALAGAVCRPLARRLGMVSMPRLWRAHSTPTPMLGGLAILAGVAAGALIGGGIHVGGLGLVAAAGVLILAFVGLVDDIAGLGAWSRFMWTSGAGVAAWLLGLRTDVFGHTTIGHVGDLALTLLWFVGVTHAVSILDHVDGVTAGIGAASAVSIALVAAFGGQFIVAVASAAVAGACLGFLVHNFPPARLFMGDMGSLAVGFALASLALALRPAQRPPLSIGVALLVVGVAIFDTTLVSFSRIRAGHPPTLGGTDHTTHRLLAHGYSVRKALAYMVGTQLVLGALALAVATSGRAIGWGIGVAVTLGGGVALVVFTRLQAWTPESHREVSDDVRIALARTLEAIHAFGETAEAAGLASTEAEAIKTLREGARRLEIINQRLSTQA